MTNPIRVYLLDDHEIVRVGIRELVDAESDMAVVGDTGSAHTALLELADLDVHIAVVDVRLGDEADGIAVCGEITSRHPNVKCLILTSFDDDQARLEAAEAGAAAFLLKQVRGNEIVETIRNVAAGAQPLDTVSVRQARRRLDGGEALLDQLTAREQQILKLIGDGRTNKEIGAELFVAEKTVKNYITSLLAKLQMERRTEAAALAARIDERRRKRFE